MINRWRSVWSRNGCAKAMIPSAMAPMSGSLRVVAPNECVSPASRLCVRGAAGRRPSARRDVILPWGRRKLQIHPCVLRLTAWVVLNSMPTPSGQPTDLPAPSKGMNDRGVASGAR